MPHQYVTAKGYSISPPLPLAVVVVVVVFFSFLLFFLSQWNCPKVNRRRLHPQFNQIINSLCVYDSKGGGRREGKKAKLIWSHRALQKAGKKSHTSRSSVSFFVVSVCVCVLFAHGGIQM